MGMIRNETIAAFGNIYLIILSIFNSAGHPWVKTNIKINKHKKV